MRIRSALNSTRVGISLLLLVPGLEQPARVLPSRHGLVHTVISTMITISLPPSYLVFFSAVLSLHAQYTLAYAAAAAYNTNGSFSANEGRRRKEEEVLRPSAMQYYHVSHVELD